MNENWFEGAEGPYTDELLRLEGKKSSNHFLYTNSEQPDELPLSDR